MGAAGLFCRPCFERGCAVILFVEEESTVKVILQERIDTLGEIGDIVNVKDGYGRNYLLPRKKAIVADERNLKALNHAKMLVEHRKVRARKEAEEMAKRLQAASVRIARKAGENDKLFGSVTAMDIDAALRAQGIDVGRRAVMLEEPIKNLGVWDVPIRLHADVSPVIKVYVVKDGETAE